MRLLIAGLTGITVGVTATVLIRRHAPAFLWWAFGRGDTP